MGLPLDQEQLIASLEELEKRLRQSTAAGEAAVADKGPRLDPAPPPYAYPQPDFAAQREPSFEVGAPAEFQAEEHDNRRRLLLAFSALIMVVFVGALGATLAYWTTPSPGPVAASPEPASAHVDAASDPVEAAAPAGEQTAPAANAAPVESAPAAPAAASIPAAQVSAAHMDAPSPAAPPAPQPATPQQVQTVTILPDGTLAPKDSSRQPDPAFAPPAYSNPSGGNSSQGSAQTAPNPSEAAKPNATGQNSAAKIAKKKAAKAAAKTAAPKKQAAATADRPAEPAPSPTPAPAGDGFLQGAQRALGSVTGAVKKLVGGE